MNLEDEYIQKGDCACLTSDCVCKCNKAVYIGSNGKWIKEKQMNKELNTHKDIFKALANGQKIRCPSWNKDWYIYLDEYGTLVDELSEPFKSTNFLDEKWEIYEEYNMNFFEALDYLREDEKHKIKAKSFINKEDGNFCSCMTIFSVKDNDLICHSDNGEWVKANALIFYFIGNRYKKLED